MTQANNCILLAMARRTNTMPCVIPRVHSFPSLNDSACKTRISNTDMRVLFCPGLCHMAAAFHGNLKKKDLYGKMPLRPRRNRESVGRLGELGGMKGESRRMIRPLIDRICGGKDF